MSDSENPQDGKDRDRHERFEELSPSGRIRSRRRKHSGPYNAPIPEAADLNALRINWQTGKPNPSPGSPSTGGAPADMEELVRRVAEELRAEAGSGPPAEAATGRTNSPNQLRQGEHPADKIPPPLPASIAVLNRQGIVHESTGKRKRKRERGHGGRRHCPFCQHNRALHIRPSNPLVRLVSILGIRTYSCRNCHSQFLAFSFVEGPYFTWRQVGIACLILLLVLAGYAFVYPLINRIPDLVQ